MDKTLSDVDYTELAELVYGQTYASDVARRMMYGSKRTLDLIEDAKLDSVTGDDVLGEIDLKMIELRKERQKFYDQRNAFNKIVRERSRQEELNEILRDAIASGNLPSLEHAHSTVVSPSGNDLLVSLNDMHYGANFSNYWCEYNSDKCAEMIKVYIGEIIKIADTHNSENCIVWANGDMISGSIHKSIQVTNKENVIKQITGVSELISCFLAELSGHFKHVYFVSVPGNHSRLEAKDDALLDERLDDLVEWYLEARLQNFDNITISAGKRIDPTMYIINVRGLNYVGVHGDFDGSAAKIQSLQTFAGKPVYAVLSGHMHHNKIDSVQGVKTIMAGSFLGMDDYCIQKRIFGRPEQLVCVVNENGIVCSYDIPLSDNDPLAY